jgi:hypothetical protein
MLIIGPALRLIERLFGGLLANSSASWRHLEWRTVICKRGNLKA